MPTLYSDLVNSPEQITVKFRFQINGTSDPDFIVPALSGVTEVTRTSAGLFAITFAEKWPVFIGMQARVLPVTAATNDLTVSCVVTSYSSTTGILSITVSGPVTDYLTVAAEDPVDDSWVYVEATFCRRSGLAPSGAI